MQHRRTRRGRERYIPTNLPAMKAGLKIRVRVFAKRQKGNREGKYERWRPGISTMPAFLSINLRTDIDGKRIWIFRENKWETRRNWIAKVARTVPSIFFKFPFLLSSRRTLTLPASSNIPNIPSPPLLPVREVTFSENNISAQWIFRGFVVFFPFRNSISGALRVHICTE